MKAHKSIVYREINVRIRTNRANSHHSIIHYSLYIIHYQLITYWHTIGKLYKQNACTQWIEN